MAVAPFTISIPDTTLDDLSARLVRTRLSPGMPGAGWNYGVDPTYLAGLCDYWREGFDWRAREAELNRFQHFRTEVDGQRLHFIHARGQLPSAIPILLLHGWPDSFARFLKLIPLLTDPRAHGLDNEVSFDVVVPSLPGFGFSDRPDKPGQTFAVHDRLHTLMTEELGYDRFAVHGGDWGAMVAENMARSHGASVIGLHLTDVPFMHIFQKPKDPSPAEQAYFKAMDAFQQKEGAYAMIQATKPLSLAMGLNDFPAGLAAWLVEKFRGWSDSGGEVETRFTKDELLTHIMLYWATGTIDSSFFPYYDVAAAGALRWTTEAIKGVLGSKDTPTAFALFPKDLVSPPRDWAERFFKVVRWTEMPRGGHFAAWEEPELLAADLRKTFAALSKGSKRNVDGRRATTAIDLDRRI